MMRRLCFPQALSKCEPQCEMQSANVKHPDLHAAIHESTARFARRVVTAAEPLILFFPQEKSRGDKYEQTDHTDDSHENQAFRCHFGEYGEELNHIHVSHLRLST